MATRIHHTPQETADWINANTFFKVEPDASSRGWSNVEACPAATRPHRSTKPTPASRRAARPSVIYVDRAGVATVVRVAQ